MFCPRCFLAKKEEKRLIKAYIVPEFYSVDEKVICDCCQNQITDFTKEYYHCMQCHNFDLCENCRVCPTNHRLSLTPNLTFFKDYEDNNFKCDICTTIYDALVNQSWHCNFCKFDVCSKCLPESVQSQFQQH